MANYRVSLYTGGDRKIFTVNADDEDDAKNAARRIARDYFAVVGSVQELDDDELDEELNGKKTYFNVRVPVRPTEGSGSAALEEAARTLKQFGVEPPAEIAGKLEAVRKEEQRRAEDRARAERDSALAAIAVCGVLAVGSAIVKVFAK